MPNSANLRAEIEDYSTKGQDVYVQFRNGSRIKVVTANDNARSNRSNIIIVDEFRMVDLTTINRVLRKFNTAPRTPKYLDNPKYSHLTERNKEFYLSSAWFKSHWSFNKLQAFFKNMLDDNKRYFCCGLPYQLAIKENLLSAEQVADEMSESDFNELDWSMEMECLGFGDTEGSLFQYDDVAKNRILKNAVYPTHISELFNNKFGKIPDLAYNERRILSVDVALLASKKQNNDAASIWINSALPTSENKYKSNFIYMENHEGLHTNDLALIVRRYFDMYKCTDLVLDVKGLGVGVYDALVREIYDPLLNKTYPPLNCCNDSTYAMRCTDKNAPKVIWAISASGNFNNTMYLNLREMFKQNRINLLVSEFEFGEYAKDIKGYSNFPLEDKAKTQLPYIQTTLLINELINLDYEVKGTNILVKEKSGMRKDRVSSVGYNCWLVSQLDQKLKPKNKENSEVDYSSLFRKPTIAR